MIDRGVSQEQLKAIEKYSQNVGQAFQLKDDLLNLYGDPAVTGKPMGSDLIQCKKNPLILSTLDRIEGTDSYDYFYSRLGSACSDDLEEMIEIVECSSAREEIEEWCQTLIEIAVEEIRTMEDVDLRIANLLIAFAEYTIRREK